MGKIPAIQPSDNDGQPNPSDNSFNKLLAILRDKDYSYLGYDKIIKKILEELRSGKLQLKLAQQEVLVNILRDANIPNFESKSTTIVEILAITKSDNAISPIIAWTDEHFGEVWGEEIGWGEDFDHSVAFEALSTIGNQEAVEYLMSHARQEKGNYSSQWDALYHLGELEGIDYRVMEEVCNFLLTFSEQNYDEFGHCALQSYNKLKYGTPREEYSDL